MPPPSLLGLIVFSLLGGSAPDWFGRAGQVTGTGGMSGKLLVFIWSVVVMMYLFMFDSMFFGMMMKPNMDKPIDTTQENLTSDIFITS